MTLGDWQDPVEVCVIVKAAPETGQSHGETVCVAGIDIYGNWHRLYPMPFNFFEPTRSSIAGISLKLAGAVPPQRHAP